MLHQITKILKHKVLISVMLLLATLQVSYGSAIAGGTLTGPSPVVPNSQQTYIYDSGLLVWGSSWVITGGSLVSSSMVINEEGDPTYQAVVLWGSAGSGTVTFKKNFTTLATKAVTITAAPAAPSVAMSNENYIRTIQPQIATTNILGLTGDQKIESVTYFDGLGRAKQSIALIAGAGYEDIVTYIDYDAFGRQHKEYLSYAASTAHGTYRTDALNATNTFYNTTKYENTTNPNSEKHFEASPLGRIKEQSAPGGSWVLNKTSDTDHTIKFDYQTNGTNMVRLYKVSLAADYTPTLQSPAPYYYGAGELYKTITKDENWKSSDGVNRTTEEFTDKQGRVVLKRTYNNGQKHDTFYVYDDYGNLTYVLPPKSEATSGMPNTTELNELCYQYKYDSRNRLVEKKISGKGWEYIVYNKLDLPVMTQDQNLKAQSKWLFTKYDAFGRVVYTGIKNSSNSRITFQNSIDTNTSVTHYETKVSSGTGYLSTYYSSTAIPTNVNEILTVNYYDNYTFDKVAGNSETSYTITPATNVKGLATGSKVKVLGTNDWITTVSYYNDKSKSIYIYSNNAYLGTTDKVKSKLDFTDQVEETTTTHTKTGQSTITTVNTFTYDHMGRLETQKHKINSLSDELITLNNYDELGQLEYKKVGGDVASQIENSTGLQTVDYKYTVRGWLKNINQDSNNDNDLFNFTIMYNDIADTSKKLYNGNISQTSWNTLNTDSSVKTYTYTYDALNRITSATDNTGNYNLTSVGYDKNGNIQNLVRKGNIVLNPTQASDFGTMDNLDYNYYSNSNRLQNVQELTGGNSTYGFKNGSTASTEYIYDANGNLLSDANKGITSISYNHLNMPTEIKFNNSSTQKINYTFTADGIKLQKVTNDNGNEITTDYAGNFVYENNSLKQFYNAEGYVEPSGTNYQYVYQYKDHQNNVRLTYTDADGNGTIAQGEIGREQNYYPFGLEHKGYNNNVVGAENNLKTYQGQEFIEDLDLNTHEWKFRMSDPSIGRFWQIDPLAENFPYNSIYAFQENKLGLGTEIEGKELGLHDWLIRESISAVAKKVNKEMDKVGMKKTEKSVAIENLYKMWKLKRANNKGKATSISKASGLTGATDGSQDAFRHSLFNALNTQTIGEKVTKEMGDAHEEDGGNTINQKKMDLHNNEVGREVAKDNPNASILELASILLDKLSNGEMVTIDASGNITKTKTITKIQKIIISNNLKKAVENEKKKN